MEPIECVRFEGKTGLKLKGKANSNRAPIHTILCVDTSGSMNFDNKLENVKRSLTMFTKCMSAGDAVSLVTFDTTAKTILKCVEINDANRILIEGALNGVKVDGSTNMSAGILSSFDCIEGAASTRKQGILLLTDGHVNVGEKSTPALIRLCDNFFRGRPDVTMTAVAYGLDHGAELLKGIAVSGRGSYNLVDNLEDVATVFGTVLGSLLSVICQVVKVEVQGEASMVTSQKLVAGEIAVGDLHSEELIPVILEGGGGAPLRVSWFNCLTGERESQVCEVREIDQFDVPDWFELALCQQRVAKLIERSARREAGLKEDIEREIERLRGSIYSGHALLQRLIVELKEVLETLRSANFQEGNMGQVDVSMMQRSAVLGLGRGFSSPVGNMRSIFRSTTVAEDPVAPLNRQMAEMSQLVSTMSQTVGR